MVTTTFGDVSYLRNARLEELVEWEGTHMVLKRVWSFCSKLAGTAYDAFDDRIVRLLYFVNTFDNRMT